MNGGFDAITGDERPAGRQQRNGDTATIRHRRQGL